MDLPDLRLGKPPGDAEEVEPPVILHHAEPRGVVEVFLVQPDGAVLFQVDQLLQDQLPKPPDLLRRGVAVGGEAHELVFPRVDPETEVVGESRVEQSHGMGKCHFLEDGDLPVLPVADGGGGPFADAVDGQDCRLPEGGGVKGAGGVGQVVVREEQFRDFPLSVPQFLHFLADEALEEDLFLDPDGDGREEGLQAPGGEDVVGLQEALELEKGLVVEDDGLQVLEADGSLLQAVAGGVGGKARIVLLPREALLLGGGDDPAVFYDGRRGIVIKGRQTQKVQAMLSFRPGAALSLRRGTFRDRKREPLPGSR